MPGTEQRSAGSYRTWVGIDRPRAVPESRGAEVIQYWANALQADLHKTMQDTAANLTAANLRRFALAAQRWYYDAWGNGGRHEHQFPINLFQVCFHADRGQMGEVLAHVDVLTGTVLEGPR